MRKKKNLYPGCYVHDDTVLYGVQIKDISQSSRHLYDSSEIFARARRQTTPSEPSRRAASISFELMASRRRRRGNSYEQQAQWFSFVFSFNGFASPAELDKHLLASSFVTRISPLKKITILSSYSTSCQTCMFIGETNKLSSVFVANEVLYGQLIRSSDPLFTMEMRTLVNFNDVVGRSTL